MSGAIASPSFLDDPRLRRVFATLDGDGEELRVVGGALRNALMGFPVTEVDLTTTATPDEVARRAAAAGLKCVPTGVEHGTQTIVVDRTPFEVTTLREDVETDGRRAIVRFGRDFRADALRRDFTINALSADAAGAVYDYADGLADIAARRVRFIGDPDARIREDYLRILRFFRFQAAYGDGAPDAAALAAVTRQRAGLATLSRERVRAEFLKLLEAERAADTIELMMAHGVLEPVLGGVAAPMRLARLDAAADAPLRLFALAVFVREDADRLRRDLRLSNVEYERLKRAAELLARWRTLAAPADHDLRLALYRFGRDAARDAARIKGAEAQEPAAWRAALAQIDALEAPRFAVSGADLAACGVKPGRAMGDALKRIEQAWIAADFPAETGPLVEAALRA